MDLVADGMEEETSLQIAWARLGDPALLAKRYEDVYRRQSFTMRHPLWVSLGGSVLLFLSLAAIDVLFFFAFRDWFAPTAFLASQRIGQVCVTVAGAVILGILLWRNIGQRWWIVLATVVFAILGSSAVLSVRTEADDRVRVTLRLIP